MTAFAMLHNLSSQLIITMAGPAAKEAKGTYGDAQYPVEAEGVFPPFDPTYFPSQIFWLLLSFGMLYFILKSVFLPKIGGVIEERSNRIADDLDTASRVQREAEEAEKAYDRALADARAKASNVAEATRQSIDAEIAAELETADAKAQEDASIAEARIAKIRQDALSNIDAVASDTASAIYAKLIGKAPTKSQLTKALKG